MIIVLGRLLDSLLSEQAIPLAVDDTHIQERSYLVLANEILSSDCRVQCVLLESGVWGGGHFALIYVRLA
jgi:hypothetical protein